MEMSDNHDGHDDDLVLCPVCSRWVDNGDLSHSHVAQHETAIDEEQCDGSGEPVDN